MTRRAARDQGDGRFFPAGDFWRGRRVFLTGHTGFKGAWLALWLRELGASVTGYALAPSTDPNLFDAIGLGGEITSLIGDIRDRDRLGLELAQAEPDVVFHLAAQALVRESYDSPLETLETNIQGTANLLNGCRSLRGLRSVIVVTSDKCYRNTGGSRPFTEDDPLGGRDPYSASKAGAEIVTEAFRASFFDGKAGIASARAGNVIGGGDWSKDRIVPDLVRAAKDGRVAAIRNPDATRPWQHVLDPLAGYLMLAQALCSEGARFASGFNFGPDPRDCATVGTLVEAFARAWNGRLLWEHRPELDSPYEAPQLTLDAAKARDRLGWRPRLGIADAIASTAAWYEAFLRNDDMALLTRRQIADYARTPAAAV